MITYIVIGCFIILLFLYLGKSDNKKKLGEIKPRNILTENEKPFFKNLQIALPDYIVLAQVSFNAFLTANDFNTRSQFNRKYADFVVLDKNFNIIAIIELDDSSHRGREHIDKLRDAMVIKAGYNVLRYNKTPSSEKIKQDFLKIKKSGF